MNNEIIRSFESLAKMYEFLDIEVIKTNIRGFTALLERVEKKAFFIYSKNYKPYQVQYLLAHKAYHFLYDTGKKDFLFLPDNPLVLPSDVLADSFACDLLGLQHSVDIEIRKRELKKMFKG